MIVVCKKHGLGAAVNVVVREPYIPFVPKKWNGVLGLTDGSNMSKKNGQYVGWLKGHSTDEKSERLYLKEDEVGIQPWDDSSLKLAVEAAFEVLTGETAVPHAVLWSQRGSNSKNINPEKKLQDLSSELWAKWLDVLNPNLVICCGKIAKDVIANTGWTGKTLALRLPSPSSLSRI